MTLFQSLSRDSGRLNHFGKRPLGGTGLVSIPQSGFGAFERLDDFQSNRTQEVVSIPQSGFGAFEHYG